MLIWLSAILYSYKYCNMDILIFDKFFFSFQKSTKYNIINITFYQIKIDIIGIDRFTLDSSNGII